MRRDNRHTAQEGGAEAARPERPIPHGETEQRGAANAREEAAQGDGSGAESFASTPETRAQEGVSPNLQEAPQVIPADHGQLPPSDSVAAPQPVAASAPNAPTASSYDPYQADRYDVYRHNLYDEDWLADDFYYNEQYYHDDRYPHLYYDNYYGNETPQPSYTAPPYHYAGTAAPSYGLLDYLDRHHEAPQRYEQERVEAYSVAQCDNESLLAPQAAHSPAAPAIYSEAARFPIERSLVSGYPSAVAVSHQEPLVVLPSYPHVADFPGSTDSHSERVISQETLAAPHQAAWCTAGTEDSRQGAASHSEALPPPLSQMETGQRTGLTDSSSNALLLPLSQSELHALEARASEAQPLAKAPAVSEVVVPLAAQHVQEPFHAPETQYSQGFAASLVHPVEGANSTLVYNSPSYVNEPENVVSREASLTLQPDHSTTANMSDFSWGSGASAYSHAPETYSEAPSYIAAAPLVASVLATPSLYDPETRLTVNHGVVAEASASSLAPASENTLISSTSDSLHVTSVLSEDTNDLLNVTNGTKELFAQGEGDQPGAIEVLLPQTTNDLFRGANVNAMEQSLHPSGPSGESEPVSPLAASVLVDADERHSSFPVIKQIAPPLATSALIGNADVPHQPSVATNDDPHVMSVLSHDTNDLVNTTNEAKGFRVLSEDGKPLAFEVLLPHAAEGASPVEAKNTRDLVLDEAVAASVLAGRAAEKGLDPRSFDSSNQPSHSPNSEKGESGKASSPALQHAGVIAGAAALGGVRVAGKAAKEVLGFAGVAVNQLLREDEDLSRIAQADDIIHDGIVAMKGAGGSSRTSLAERLIRSEIAAEDQLGPATKQAPSADEKAARGKHAAVKQPTLREKAEAAGAKELLVSTRDEEISLVSDSMTGAERMSASLREASAPSGRDSIEGLLSLGSDEERDGKPGMASRSKAIRSEKRESVEGLLAEPVKESGRDSVSEKGVSAKVPAIVRGAGERDLEAVCGPKSSVLAAEKEGSVKCLVTSKGKGASVLEDDLDADGVLNPKNPKDGKAKKKPATERERELAKKEAKRKAARKDGRGDSKALSVVNVGKNAGLKGALLVGGMAKSGAKKVVSERNEELAVAMSTVEKTKKTVRVVRKIAHAPIFLMQQARRAVHAVVTSVKAVFSGAATLTAMGPVGGFIALMAFVLLIVIIAVLLGTASIINDEQEVSEVSALVAELDAQLTEEINALGHTPILYLDASDTYNAKDDEGNLLTKDADLADDRSDLKEVVASSVTVRTDPAEIAAYIDAKYTGNWQVGAASWKYTVEAFGETWNLIEWEDMPEWAWKALNKVNRTDFKVTLRNELTSLLMEDFGVEESVASAIASDTADEFATVIFDNQIQGMNDDVLMQIIRDSVKAHKSDLDLSDDEVRKLYYKMQKVISNLIGEEDPFAFVYDEIVLLHERLNWWSEEYGSFGLATSPSAGSILSLDGTGSGTMNAYGYPNSYGYDEEELANWDGFNEVSVYGISEAGTTSVTADGTRITNTWADMTMGIACEGLQNDVFAYWTPGYQSATGTSGDEPVKITLYNPSTGKSITAEVIDCGGWRGYNERYAGKNLDRQWDLLPAVWKALGGSESAGTMRVYWKVDPDAVVGQAALQPKTFEDYPWPKETDGGDDEITLTRPTLVVHDVQDALMNDPLMEEIIDRDTFRTDAEFEAVKSFVVLKVKDVMKTLLTMENGEGDEFVDYNYLRRDLGDPFGEDGDGNPREWVIAHRYNPGYEEFELDDAYVEVKPLGDATAVHAIMEGEVEKIDNGEVTVRTYIDTANSAEVVYSTLKDIKVEEGDEIKEGQKLGTMAGSALRVKYYEINDTALQIETKKDWAYDAGLYMEGFAGYEEPEEPQEYVNMVGDWSGCTTVVEFARSRLGCPYVWGATGPDTFDCSGLTQWCYAQAGISIPRNSEAQRAGGQVVPLSEVQPGDILWKPGHVGIYIGGDLYIHAPHTGDVVKISSNAKGAFTCGLRYG